MNQRVIAAALPAALLFSSVAWADDVAPPAPPVTEAKAEAVWADDFDKAVEIAKKEKKDLFVDFTGSDWCGWCVRLHKEVFSHEEFLSEIRKEYVLVALDFPHGDEAKAKVPNPARNEELMRKYNIQGYPTVLLVTPEGDVFGKLGYQPGGPEKYVQMVGILRDKGLPELKAAKELTRLINEGKGPERTTACEKAIAALRELTPDSDQAMIRATPVHAAFASDPENKDGIAAKALSALFRVRIADDASFAAASKFDPKNELGLLEQAVNMKSNLLGTLDDVKAFVKSVDELVAMGELKDKDTAKLIYVNTAFLNYQHLRDPAKALDYAKRAQAVGFGPAEDQMKKLMDKIVADEGKAPEAPHK
jgi:thioredoxin-related protein